MTDGTRGALLAMSLVGALVVACSGHRATSRDGGTGNVGTSSGAAPSCQGWVAAADTCAAETAGLIYICDCPGYGGCLFGRFADASCSACSPYSPPALNSACQAFFANGQQYGEIGSDPRWATCTCADGLP